MDTINVETNENGANEGLNKTNSLEKFYAGSEILVTGATGFVETDLLEKLMSVCPRVVAIFILIRPKTNETIEQRFKKLIDDPIRKYNTCFLQCLTLSGAKLINSHF